MKGSLFIVAICVNWFINMNSIFSFTEWLFLGQGLQEQLERSGVEYSLEVVKTLLYLFVISPSTCKGAVTHCLKIPLLYVRLLSQVQHCNPMDCRPPDPSVHGIFQARILECFVISSSRGSSVPRDRTHVSCLLHWQVDSLTLAPYVSFGLL